jgi:hypothetical protein
MLFLSLHCILMTPLTKARTRWYEELGGTRVAELAAGFFSAVYVTNA